MRERRFGHEKREGQSPLTAMPVESNLRAIGRNKRSLLFRATLWMRRIPSYSDALTLYRQSIFGFDKPRSKIIEQRTATTFDTSTVEIRI